MNKTSVKLSNVGIDFLKNLRTNRRKVETDDKDLSYWELIEVMVKYFKLNNDKYIEVVKIKK